MSSRLPEAFEALANALDRRKVCWAFAREPAVIKWDAENGKDIDIWCSSSDVAKVIKLLHTQNWRIYSGRCIPRFHRNSGICGSLRFSHRSRSHLPSIELHFGDLRWRFVRYCPESVMKYNIMWVNGRPYAGGAALLCILITRGTLRGRMNSSYGNRACAAWFSASPKHRQAWYFLAREKLGSVTTSRIMNLLMLASISLPDSSNLIFPRPPSIWRLGLLSLVDLISVFPAFVISRLRRRQSEFGTDVAFVGSDGSGKTTLIAKSTISLDNAGYSCQATYWGRSRNNSLWVVWLRRLGLRILQTTMAYTSKKKVKGSSAYTEHTTFFKLFSVLGGPIYMIDYWLRYLVQVRKQIRHGVIVLLDRSPIDIALMPGPVWLNKLVARRSPKIRLTIWCRAAPDVILKRKQERTVHELIRHQGLYLEFARERMKKGSFLIIDTDHIDANSAAEIVTQATLACLAAQHGDLDRVLQKLLIQALSAPIDNAENPLH